MTDNERPRLPRTAGELQRLRRGIERRLLQLRIERILKGLHLQLRWRLLELRTERLARAFQQQMADMAVANEPSDPAAQQAARERIEAHDREAAQWMMAEVREKGYI